MIYIIADTHFGHENIIKLCNRPFESLQEMDETLIQNWNSVVKPQDDVYIIGDFAYKSDDPWKYASKLHGKKHLVVGNHDRMALKNPDFRSNFVEIKDIRSIKYNKKRIIMCHYPLAEWEGMYHGSIHFFGHIHNSNGKTQKIMAGIENAYNVGADVIGFTPRTIEQIIEKNY